MIQHPEYGEGYPERMCCYYGAWAYEEAKHTTGAYVIRGNSIVKVTADCSILVVKRLGQVKVQIKDSDRFVVIK